MIIVPMGLLLVAYQLMWYGYAVLQQPLPGSCSTCGDGCVGFVDLLLPTRAAQVDKCIQSGWKGGGAQGSGFPAIPGQTLPSTGGQTIYVPGKGLVNPAPSPGWAGK